MSAVLTEEDFALFARWRVGAFGDKLREIVEDEACDDLTFEDKVGMCIDAELEARENRKIQKAMRDARFKIKTACVEDIYYLPDRSVTRDRIARLASCSWVEARENLVIISESGGGKSYIAQALGVAACRRLHSVRYAGLNDMFRELNVARAEDSLYEALGRFSKPDLLVLDDFFTTPVENQLNAIDLFEMLEAREGVRLHAHRHAAGARPVIPEDQLGPVRGLHPQQDSGACEVPRHKGAEHAGVHDEAEARGRRVVLGMIPVPDGEKGGTASNGEAVPPARNMSTNYPQYSSSLCCLTVLPSK
ncbi:ATP-binding protein [Collinsella ihumii]|uniref:ATP-binding protein n=1 Tax=Collinsella ihumii TaxID=1720204 RepID=UPI000834AC0D|nr:ATP-binding protein [Collinsella ihumii]